MKHVENAFFLACKMVAMMGCLGNAGPEPTVITDPSATTHLSIANRSGLDLTVKYKTTDSYGGLDSTIAAPNDSITQIFEPGGFSFPTPSEALIKLSFYKSTAADDQAPPMFSVEPIVDEHWNDVTAKVDTVKKYELVITEKDLN